MQFKKPKNLIGINISASSIRLVELLHVGSNYEVLTCINMRLDENSSDELIINALKKIFEQNKFNTKNVAVALSHSAIIFKEIKIECGLADKEIEDFLQFNIEKYIGESASNISFDYRVTDKRINNIALIAVRRERVEKYVKLLSAANFHLKVVDIDSYALERAVRLQLKNITELIAIINIDSGSILIVVINHEKIVYAHEDFINALEMQTVAQVIFQLKLKLQFVFASLREPLGKIILAGEKATLLGLSEMVMTEFNVQIAIINPFFGMQVSQNLTQKIAPEMLVSCGLALREISVVGINLLPWRKELRFKSECYFKIQILIIFSIVAIILVSWHLTLWRQINITVKQTSYMRRQLSLFERKMQHGNSIKQQQQQAQQIFNRISNLEERRAKLIQVFENLHRGITISTQLVYIMIKNDGSKLLGKTDSMFGILQLIKSLGQAPVIQKISRQYDEYNFVLSFFI